MIKTQKTAKADVCGMLYRDRQTQGTYAVALIKKWQLEPADYEARGNGTEIVWVECDRPVDVEVGDTLDVKLFLTSKVSLTLNECTIIAPVGMDSFRVGRLMTTDLNTHPYERTGYGRSNQDGARENVESDLKLLDERFGRPEPKATATFKY